MKRTIIIASHSKMAEGLKDTLEFVSGGSGKVIALSAYLDNSPVEGVISDLMERFDEDEEVVVLTDIAFGSVNQQFFKYRNRPHTHIISGMTLPLALQITMEPDQEYLSEACLQKIIENAKAEIKYMQDVEDKDEEDE